MLLETRNVLIGRTQERAQIERLVADARNGVSNVLLVCGEPGIGKSALLDHAVRIATGMRVLSARGLQSESELAFAGLHELLRPVLDAIDEIPAPQAVALRGALRLAPAAETDRFAISAATLSVLGVVAEREPILAVVDDAQWLDTASAEAIVFAARRLAAEGVLVLAALREDDDSPFLQAGFAELLLAGLDRDGARDVLEVAFPMRVSPRVADQLLETTGGNPLALIELASQLSSDQLVGVAPLSEPLPASRSIEQAFARRLGALSPPERSALLVAAASESERLDLILPAAIALGAGPEAFEAAEAAGLVRIDDGRLSFRHPLLRSTIYSSSPPVDRRSAHRALAETIPDESSHERAWHEAAATIVADERVAAALELAAEDARRRSGYAAASRALERAARLTPSAEERARRLFAAGASARRASLSWAGELLREAHELAADPVLRFDIELVQAAVEVWSGSVVSAARRYVESADRLEPPDPERQVRALSYGAACWGATGAIGRGLATARRAVALAEAPPIEERTRLLAVETLGSLLVEHGETSEGRELVLAAAAMYEQQDGAVDTDFVSLALLWLEEYELARRLIEPLVSASRRASDLRTLAAALELLAELEFRTGDWSTATTAAAESARLAEETGRTTQLAYSLAGLATVEGGRGDEACRRHAARAVEVAQRSGLGIVVQHADYALGLLELGLGEPEHALTALERAAAYAERAAQGEPGVFQWGPELVEAYVLAGRKAQAVAALEAFERQAQASGRAWALATAARCHGLLADERELDAPFLEALRLHENAQAPFQLARTELAYGRRLRRARRRVDSREQLRRAIATFERLGARPWLEAARRELAASGETLRTGVPAARDLLTPQELQISQIVAGGMTNRDAAASLFLSPKTIESHLQNAYRKLGVHSRTQLANRLQEVRG